MDISRLPIAPLARPATSPFKNTRQAASAEPVAPVERLNPQTRARESVERVVQGELLQRERAPYQSTRAFINQRTLDQTRPADHQAAPPGLARSAISRYMNNTRPESLSELTGGKAVNFFV